MTVHRRDLRRGEGGWSFLETAVVMIVVGVMAALVAKPLNGLLLRIKLQITFLVITHIFI